MGQTGSRLAGIEGVRAVAAVSVLVVHVWLYGYGGPLSVGGVELGPATKLFQNLSAGVTLFFVLSGFLLFRPYATAVLKGGRWPSPARYFRNRALRILPAWLFILTAVALLLQRELIGDPLRFGANALFLREFVPAYSFHSSPADPTGGHSGLGIDPAWSLAIEVCFYLALPVVSLAALWAARRIRPGAAVFVPAGLLLALGAAGQVAYRLHPSLGYVWERSFVPYAGYFAVGMAVAAAYAAWDSGRLHPPRGWRPVAVLAAAAVGACATKLFYSGQLLFDETQGIDAIAFGLVLAVIVTAHPSSRLLCVLDSRPFVAVGLASYSLFLWHDPLVRELRDAGLTFPGRGGFLLNLLVIGAISGLAAALTYRFVEKPALARKSSAIAEDGRARGRRASFARLAVVLRLH